MSSIYNTGGTFQNGPYGQSSQFVIPQITIPNGVGVQQRWEPLTAPNRDAAYKTYTPPGVRVPIFDESQEIFYYKETDAAGNIVAFETYSYAKVEEPALPQYLTVDAFNSFVGEFNKFREEMLNGQSVRTQGHNNRSYNNFNQQSKPSNNSADSGSK